jgi:2-phosphosulfolactate phosphatase
MVLDGLSRAPGGLSVEAAIALSVLDGVSDVASAIRGSASGRELVVGGFEADLDLAVQVGVSDVVPALRAGVFGPAT